MISESGNYTVKPNRKEGSNIYFKKNFCSDINATDMYNYIRKHIETLKMDAFDEHQATKDIVNRVNNFCVSSGSIKVEDKFDGFEIVHFSNGSQGSQWQALSGNGYLKDHTCAILTLGLSLIHI